MKRIMLFTLILFAVSLASATRASGYATSAAVSINTLMPPTELTMEYMDGIVQLYWSSPIIGVPSSYKVYRSETPEIPASFYYVGDSSTEFYEDYEFFYGGYYITAVYAGGESRASNIAYIGRMQAVSVSLSLDYSSNSALISWVRVRDADSYLLYYSDNPYAEFPAQWSRPITLADNQFIDPLSDRRFYKVMAQLSDRNSDSQPVLIQSKRK